MSDDLERLLDGDCDPRVRDALASASADEPRAETIRRAARALGLPLTAALLAASPVAKATTVVGATAILKWIAVGVATGVGVSGVAIGVETVTGPTESSHSEVSAPSMTSSSDQRPNGPTSELGEPTPITHERRHVARPMTSRSSADALGEPAASARGDAATDDSLSREVALLAEARAALVSGNAEAALAKLDAYEAAHTRRTLAAEATVLRVRALVAAGRKPEAAALVDRYAAGRPNDAYLWQLQELLGRKKP